MSRQPGTRVVLVEGGSPLHGRAAMAMGVVNAVLGVALLAWPGPTLAVLVGLLGIAMLVGGLVRILFAATDDSEGSRGARIVVGLVGVGAGLLDMRAPLDSLALLVAVVGVFWTLWGLAEVFVALTPAGTRGCTWTTPLRDVVYLGTPHLGAWLEKVANVVSWTLRRASPQSAPLGRLLDRRSRGIKDLRFGTLVEDLPGARGIDDLLAGLVTPDPPWLDGVTHHLVVGRLREPHGHLLNAVFGDAMVRSGSAGGPGRWRHIPDGGPVRVAEVAAPHGHLVTHPDVTDLVDEVLAGLPGATGRPVSSVAPGQPTAGDRPPARARPGNETQGVDQD